MQSRHLFVVLLAGAACGKAGKKGFMLSFKSYNTLPVHYEVPGAKPDTTAGIYDLAELPATGTPITAWTDTVCGRLEVKFPFPDTSSDHRNEISSGPYEGYVEIEVETHGKDAMPVAEQTMIYIDPKMQAPVLAAGKPLHNNQLVLDIACAKQISIAGTMVDLPPVNITGHRPSLLVTASADTCFRDESVAYGDARGGGFSLLKGARLYLLNASEYQSVFQAPDKTARVAAGGTGTSRYALYEVPCAAEAAPPGQ